MSGAGLSTGAAELLSSGIGAGSAAADAYENGKAQGLEGKDLFNYVALHAGINAATSWVFARGGQGGRSVSGKALAYVPGGQKVAGAVSRSPVGRGARAAAEHGGDNLM